MLQLCSQTLKMCIWRLDAKQVKKIKASAALSKTSGCLISGTSSFIPDMGELTGLDISSISLGFNISTGWLVLSLWNVKVPFLLLSPTLLLQHEVCEKYNGLFFPLLPVPHPTPRKCCLTSYCWEPGRGGREERKTYTNKTTTNRKG